MNWKSTLTNGFLIIFRTRGGGWVYHKAENMENAENKMCCRRRLRLIDEQGEGDLHTARRWRRALVDQRCMIRSRVRPMV